jgi:hypothetical protein
MEEKLIKFSLSSNFSTILPDLPSNANFTDVRFENCFFSKDSFEVDVSFPLESPIFTPF